MSSVADSTLLVPVRTRDRMVLIAWSVVAAVVVMRAVAASTVPLIGDEAYYWEWSRHLALGYSDHPPAVAYTIAAFSWLGRNPFAVRIGFVLCGAFATIWIALTATRLAGGDSRAGAASALALTLAPLAVIAGGTASPDGPYLAAWAATLYAATRAFASRDRRDYVWLGLALGAVLLTRVLALALPFGLVCYALAPQRRHLWRDGLWLSGGLAMLLCAPFLWWNATHDWVTFAFAFVARHAVDWNWLRPLTFQLTAAAAYSPGLWVAGLACALVVRNALINWTALPLIVLLTGLAVHEPIETYWAFGAYLSLCVAIGLGYVRLAPRARRVWAAVVAAPAIVILPLVFVAAVWPGFVYDGVARTGAKLKNTGAFEIFTVPQLALDVRRLMQTHDATVVTDGYGLSSTLDFYGGVPPVVIGYDAQGAEAKRWYDADVQPHELLFVDKEPLTTRPDFAQRLDAACGAVAPGPTLGYAFRDASGQAVPVRPYFTTWCLAPRASALRILDWEPTAR